MVSNVVDTRSGKPIGNAVPYLVKTFGTLKVGFIGLCLNTLEVSGDKLTHTRIIDPIAAARKYVPMLKHEGAQVVVAVTHLAYLTDRAMVEAVPQIDLVIGGHEHYVINSAVNGALISKAGEDARYVARIDVNRRPGGAVERFYELIPTSSAFVDDPDTAAVIATYNTELDKALETVAGVTRVPLEARSQQMRTSETNLGNMFADAIRADAGTDVALTNSGSIRGNRIYPAGPLTRKMLVEMHPFDNVICKLAMPGRVLLEALNIGVARLPLASGQFPQVSGLTMVVDLNAPVGSRVKDVRVNGAAARSRHDIHRRGAGLHLQGWRRLQHAGQAAGAGWAALRRPHHDGARAVRHRARRGGAGSRGTDHTPVRVSRTLTSAALVLGIALAATPAPISALRSQPPSAAAPAEIRLATRHYADLILAMDATGLAGAFAPDGEMVVVGQPPVRGRATIREAFESFKDYKVQAEEMTTDYIAITGTGARAEGAYKQTVRVPDGSVVSVHGTYVAEWIRAADGSWLIKTLTTTPQP